MFQAQRSVKKVMLIVFWYMKWLITIDFLGQCLLFTQAKFILFIEWLSLSLSLSLSLFLSVSLSFSLSIYLSFA